MIHATSVPRTPGAGVIHATSVPQRSVVSPSTHLSQPLTAKGPRKSEPRHAAPLATWIDRRPFPIFVVPEADAIAMPWFGFAAAITLLPALYDLCREWMRVEPAPAARSHEPSGSTALEM